jgi:arylsulfatase A-like enzyme
VTARARRTLALLVALGGCGETISTPARTAEQSPTEHAAQTTARVPAGADPAGPLGALAGQDCLIVVLDALHAAHLGAWGGDPAVAPHLDGLAADGVRFARAWSQSSWTLPSTVSLFTGLYPQTHGVTFDGKSTGLRLKQEAVTLAERFAEAGHATALFTQNPFAGRHFGLEQGFGRFEEHRSDGPGMTDAVIDHLAAPSERPRFTYVHYRRPHSPYDPDEVIRERLVDPAYDGPVTGSAADIERHNDGARPLAARDVDQLRALYRANIHQVDRELGRVLAAVDADRTLVLVLSDHGEAFGEHGRLGHNWRSYEEYVHVPLVLSHPALAAGVHTTPVMTLDLAPTLTELFDLSREGPPLQGASLRSLLAGGAPPAREGVFTSSRRHAQGQQQLAVLDGTLKYVEERSDGRTWLFDLAEDPGERSDLSASRPEDAARLQEVLRRWHQGQRTSYAVDDGSELDAETLARLRKLGYVGGR